MTKKKGRNRIPRLFLKALAGILFIAVLWFLLSALFSAAPPISYVTSCSMYPEYSRGDMLLVLPLSPSVQVEGYDGLLSRANPWVVSFGNNTTVLDASISTYCNNSVEQMCREFYENPAGFSETNGPVTYEYARCTNGRQKSEPCVVTAKVGNASFSTAQRPQAIVYGARVFAGSPAIPVIHRAFFAVRDASGSTYLFTKGDANPLFDSQSPGFFSLNGAAAANASSVHGIVVARIPFAGEFLRGYRGIPGC
ncbi:MAG: S26 family signal peptidase [Candidatus Micrarchaeia archaeon]|jgi:signal peptidase I